MVLHLEAPAMEPLQVDQVMEPLQADQATEHLLVDPVMELLKLAQDMELLPVEAAPDMVLHPVEVGRVMVHLLEEVDQDMELPQLVGDLATTHLQQGEVRDTVLPQVVEAPVIVLRRLVEDLDIVPRPLEVAQVTVVDQ